MYYVNDILGQPFFSIEKVIDPGMIDVLRQDVIPRLLGDIPNQPSLEELAGGFLGVKYFDFFEQKYDIGMIEKNKVNNIENVFKS